MMLPHVEAWTEKPCREWFSHCDRCKKRRIVADYHEFYAGPGEGWWRECMNCSFTTVAAWGMEYRTGFQAAYWGHRDDH